MFSRKFSSNIRRKKRMITSLIILLVVFLSIGYSAFTSNLSINGTLGVSKYEEKTLYGVLEKAAIEGTYAKEYTGEHQDSMAGVGDKKIYHWWADNDTNGTAILDMNNVIFANHCWQMIRTTDTGGVKMIYNGEPEDDKCLNTRGNHVGYASRTTQSMSTTYYYGTSYTYDKENNVFSLDGTVTTGAIQTGQYTCKTTTNDPCATLYLVDTLSSGTTYYVLPLNSNSSYSQFGELPFNRNDDSPAYAGYMYNTVYPNQSNTITQKEPMLSSSSLYTHDWYADSVTWGSPIANKYNLDNPYRVSATTDYPNLVGKYTFNNSDKNYTNASVYYIAAVNGSNSYYIVLNNSGNHTLSDFNYTYTYGDSFTDNGNDTYTINNPTTINRSDWYTSYNNVGNGKYVCKNAINNTCSELWYTTATTENYMYYRIANTYKYAKGFTWDGSKYVLDNDTSITLWDITDSTNQTKLNNAHYTCLNESGECTTIAYFYFIGKYETDYINISNGKSIENAKNEMLYNDNINTTNSTIKAGIDAWYEKHMTGYTELLEDTIFCNNRNINDFGGWNPNGGIITSDLYFENYSSNSDLSCTNITDKFSVANPKATLTYPVGLLTSPEIHLFNNNNIRKTGHDYWLASPGSFFGDCRRNNCYGNIFDNSIALVSRVNSTGDHSYYHLLSDMGVRPAISLKPGTEFIAGSGCMSDPYIIDYDMKVTSNLGGKITATVTKPADSTIEYSIDGENWQDSNTFTVTEDGTYTVYAKITTSTGSDIVLSKEVDVEIGYTINFKVGLHTAQTVYVKKGESLTLPDNYYSYYTNDYYGNHDNNFTKYCYHCHQSWSISLDVWLFDGPIWNTRITGTSFTPTKNTDIYIAFSPFIGGYSGSDYMMLIEKKENLSAMNLEFVKAEECNNYACSSPVTSTDYYLNAEGNVVGDCQAMPFLIYYRDKTTGEEQAVEYTCDACLVRNTRILVEIEEEEEDKKKKKKKKRKKKRVWKYIQDITYDDDLVVWDFDNGCETTAKPLWIMKEQENERYIHVCFDDGTELNAVVEHRIFNVDSQQFTYLMDEENTPLGTNVYKEDGSIVKLISREYIDETVKYYNIITEYHMNLFANDLLTSLRLNNLYEIKDMKFVKDNRELAKREDFKDITDDFYYGLRLAEQPKNKDINRLNAIKHANTLEEYVKRLYKMMKPKD